MSGDNQAHLRNQSTQSPSDEKRVSVSEAVQWAEEHLFDRNSVVLECQVWQEALGRARGEDFSVAELTRNSPGSEAISVMKSVRVK